MFASEQVMREYLSDLLNEEQQDALTAEKQQKDQINKKNTEKSAAFAVNKEQDKNNYYDEGSLELRPIKSKVNRLPQFEEAQVAVEELKAPEPNSVESLLAQVEAKQAEIQKEKELQQQKQAAEPIVDVEQAPSVTVAKAKVEPDVLPKEAFQALFFEVAGLVLAVPLYELGGIHTMTEINTLFGKPNWYKGVMVNRDKKLNVVDSARWVMPEKYDEQMEQSIDYKYLITLGESDWGLAAEKLVETHTINIEDVKWRSGKGKRPWLYGTIKKKMCALLHVNDLIAMLEQGVNARQE